MDWGLCSLGSPDAHDAGNTVLPGIGYTACCDVMVTWSMLMSCAQISFCCPLPNGGENSSHL